MGAAAVLWIVAELLAASLLNLVQTLLIKIEALPPANVKWDGTLLNTQLEF